MERGHFARWQQPLTTGEGCLAQLAVGFGQTSAKQIRDFIKGLPSRYLDQESPVYQLLSRCVGGLQERLHMPCHQIVDPYGLWMSTRPFVEKGDPSQ